MAALCYAIDILTYKLILIPIAFYYKLLNGNYVIIYFLLLLYFLKFYHYPYKNL